MNWEKQEKKKRTEAYGAIILSVMSSAVHISDCSDKQKRGLLTLILQDTAEERWRQSDSNAQCSGR